MDSNYRFLYDLRILFVRAWSSSSVHCLKRHCKKQNMAARSSEHLRIRAQGCERAARSETGSQARQMNEQNMPRQLFFMRRALLLCLGYTLYDCMCVLLRIYLATCKLAVYSFRLGKDAAILASSDLQQMEFIGHT